MTKSTRLSRLHSNPISSPLFFLTGCLSTFFLPFYAVFKSFAFWIFAFADYQIMDECLEFAGGVGMGNNKQGTET